MPLEWSTDERGIYHALAHYTDSENAPWTALCGTELTPSLSQRVESEDPPHPSHRECATMARLSGGFGPREVERMVESSAFPPLDDPRWNAVVKERLGALHEIDTDVEGSLTVTEDTRTSRVVRGDVTIAAGALLVVNGIVSGSVVVELGALELHGTVGRDVLVRSRGSAEIYGTVSGSVILEEGASARVDGVVRSTLSDPWNVAEVAEGARIGSHSP
ncbi:MAG: hypothetical protein WD846_04495 [Patescibacteria group bacterium]